MVFSAFVKKFTLFFQPIYMENLWEHLMKFLIFDQLSGYFFGFSKFSTLFFYPASIHKEPVSTFDEISTFD